MESMFQSTMSLLLCDTVLFIRYHSI